MTQPPQTLTPSTHGQWRVIDGQLVDESALPQADVLTKALTDAQATQDAEPTPSPRRKAPAKTE